MRTFGSIATVSRDESDKCFDVDVLVDKSHRTVYESYVGSTGVKGIEPEVVAAVYTARARTCGAGRQASSELCIAACCIGPTT